MRASVPSHDSASIAPPGAATRPVTHIRSTLIMASQSTLREEGLFERYLTLLPPDLRDQIAQLGAPSWQPISAGIAHYGACHRLGLTPEQVVAIAERVSMRGDGSFLGVALNLARGAGVTPWAVANQVPRIWSRGFHGGGIHVVNLGPKELRLDIVGWPCASIPYCRDAFRGLTSGVMKLLCRQLYVREVPVADAARALSLLVSWV